MSPYRSALSDTRQPFKRSLYGRLRRAYRKFLVWWWATPTERAIRRAERARRNPSDRALAAATVRLIKSMHDENQEYWRRRKR